MSVLIIKPLQNKELSGSNFQWYRRFQIQDASWWEKSSCNNLHTFSNYNSKGSFLHISDNGNFSPFYYSHVEVLIMTNFEG